MKANFKKLLVLFVMCWLLIGSAVFNTGCNDEGPAEEAGEEIDEAVEEVDEEI